MSPTPNRSNAIKIRSSISTRYCHMLLFVHVPSCSSLCYSASCSSCSHFVWSTHLSVLPKLTLAGKTSTVTFSKNIWAISGVISMFAIGYNVPETKVLHYNVSHIITILDFLGTLYWRPIAWPGHTDSCTVSILFLSHTVPPEVEVTATLTRVAVGNTTTLTCTVNRSNPMGGYTYRWVHNDSITLSENGSMLTVSVLSESNFGVYRCEVTNSAGLSGSKMTTIGHGSEWRVWQITWIEAWAPFTRGL